MSNEIFWAIARSTGSVSTRDILTHSGYPGFDLAAMPAVLVGGFSGRWVQPESLDRVIGNAGLPAGTGIIYPLLRDEQPLAVASSMLKYLADENAGQCGPCVNGLPALAQAFEAAVRGVPGASAEVQRLGAGITGRGMCKHPDATAHFAAHSLTVFAGTHGDSVARRRGSRVLQEI